MRPAGWTEERGGKRQPSCHPPGPVRGALAYEGGGITGTVRRGPVQGSDLRLPLPASQHAGADHEVSHHVALGSGPGSATSFGAYCRNDEGDDAAPQSCRDIQRRPCCRELTVSSTVHGEDPWKSVAVLFGFHSGPCVLIHLCNSYCAEIPTPEISKEPNFMQRWTRAQDKSSS